MMIRFGLRGSGGIRQVLAIGMVVLLAACRPEDNGEAGSAANRPPVVDAGADSVVLENTDVALDGSASDPDGNPVTYAWTQVAGPAVTIRDPGQASAAFTAPDVTGPVNLTFRLTVTDDRGAAASDDVTLSVQEPGLVVNLTGFVRYEFPPPANACRGLDFSAVEQRPIRGATLQVIDAGSNGLVATTTTGPDGSYSVVLDAEMLVFVRVVSELKRSGGPAWDVEVRNNVVDPADPNPPALANRPKYFLDSAQFDTGTVSLRRDLLAATGWTGSGYGEPRAAAPFAVLDTIYEMMQLVLSVRPTTTFPPLDAYWSPANGTSAGTGSRLDDIDTGDLGSSFYTSGIDSLFLLGREGDDAQPGKNPGQQIGDERAFDELPRPKARKIVPAGSIADIPTGIVAIGPLKVGIAPFDDLDKRGQGKPLVQGTLA